MTIGTRLRHIVGDTLGAEIVEYNLEKAIKDARERADAPATFFYDPMELFMGREWLVKRNQPLTYDDLRSMAKNPILGSIIQTRINQVAAFAVPQATVYDQGFVIKPINDSIADKTDTRAEIRNFIFTAGIPGYGEDLLETFIRKFLRDSLILDQACAEVVMARNGKTPAYFVAIDAATIRLLRKKLDYAVPPGDVPLYVQILQDKIVTQFRDDQMIFGVRNPQSDVRAVGYGMSEMEMLIRIVTMILNTEKYNSGLLAQGGTQKGILVVKGEIAQDNNTFEAFKRDFREAIRNAADYWRPPVIRISKEGEVDWVTLDRSQRDMEYAQLFDFLVKQACGVYQMSPEEINWSIGPSSAKVNFEANTSGKLTHSQQKGLKPLLTFLANHLNISVVQKINPEYRMEFVGLGVDRDEDSTIHMREVQNFKTLNEVRAELGKPALPGGDIVLNNIYLKHLFGEEPEEEIEEEVDLNPEFDTTRRAQLLTN